MSNYSAPASVPADTSYWYSVFGWIEKMAFGAALQPSPTSDFAQRWMTIPKFKIAQLSLSVQNAFPFSIFCGSHLEFR